MKNWDTRDESGLDIGCEWEKDWEDVQRVCKILGIPCELVSQNSFEYLQLVLNCLLFDRSTFPPFIGRMYLSLLSMTGRAGI